MSLLKSHKHFAAPPVVVTLRVLSLHRFLIDDQYIGMTTVSAPLTPPPYPPPYPPPPPPTPSPHPPFTSTSGYDVVLIDLTHRTKATLHPSLTHLIELGLLTPSTLLTVYDSGVRYDESVIGGAGCVLIRGLIVHPSAQPLPPLPSPLPEWGSREGSREREHRPLVGSRGYYLALYNDDSIDLPPSLPPPPPTLPPFALFERAQSLITILGTVSGDYTGSQCVVARVIAKSRLVHFGRAGKGAAYPFFFELLLLDATASVKATVWNSLVPRYYRQLQVGQVVALEGFKLTAHDAEEVELMVNPYNPAGAVHQVQREEVEALEPPVPPVPLTLMRLERVREVRDGQHVDVFGLCVWTGPLCREVSRGERGQFHCFRYLLVGDEDSDAALPMKVYCNSQDERVCSIQAGDVVVVTNVTLSTTEELTGSRAERSCCAQTSNFSHVYAAQEMLEKEWDDDVTPRATSLLQWRDSGEWKLRDWRSVWRWDVSLDHHITRQGVQGQLSITPIRELRTAADALRFIEAKDLVLQGVVVAVTAPSSSSAVEQKAEAAPPAKRRKGSKGRRKAKAARPAALEVAASLESVAQPASIPLTTGTRPVLQLTLTDLNHEHEVQVMVHDRPVPYAALGGPGTVAHDLGQQLPALPPLLLLLLQLLPSSSVPLSEVEELVARFAGDEPSAGEQGGQGRLARGGGPGRRRGRGGRAEGAVGQSLSSSQPPPVRVTWSQRGKSMESQSQDTVTTASSGSSRSRSRSRGREAKEMEGKEEVGVEQGGLTEEEVAEVVSNACQRWLVGKQVLACVHLYRVSYATVDTSLTTIFSVTHQSGVE